MRPLSVFSLLLLALWLGNTSAIVALPEDRTPRLLAHRGVHQIHAGTERTNDTCTANPILPVTHDYIANTRRSMQAAFGFGADVVEIDVHLTPDGQFAVFHDWRLECQTDGTGVTHEQPMTLLRGLDLGHGYTSDGESFPLRGTARGQMPTLAEVLSDGSGPYLINFKSRRAEEGAALAELLSAGDHDAQVFGVYGGAPPTRAALAARPGLRGYDRPALKACVIRYALLGWSGYVPEACRDRLIALPLNVAPWLWGWPHRLTARMATHGTTVILLGPLDGSGFSSGIDDEQMLARVPDRLDAYLWTNRIEVIGPLRRAKPAP